MLFRSAFGAAKAHAHLTSVMGTSVTGKANDVFMAGFNKMFPKQAAAGPLSGSNYSYDAVITLALADTYAKTFAGATVAKNMPKVNNPPGTICYSYGSCLALLKQGKKINYEGASGSIDYNSHNNTFGPYAPFIANATTGNEVQGSPLSAKLLGDVTNCKTTSACLAALKANGLK